MKRDDVVREFIRTPARLVAEAIEMAEERGAQKMHFMLFLWDEHGNYSRSTDAEDGDAQVLRQLALPVEIEEREKR